MRIAISNPYSWPFVRRGSERFIQELATFLVARGHDVTIICSTPARSGQERTDGIKAIRYCQREYRALARCRIPALLPFSLQTFHALMKQDFDVVHCMTYFDGFAAAVAKQLKGQKYLFHIAGIPVAAYFRPIPLDNLMFRVCSRKADRVLVASNTCLDYLTNDYGINGTLIHTPVDVKQFTPGKKPCGAPPIILMVGDINQERKGAKLLAKAFAEVKKVLPDAVIKYSGQVSDRTRNEILSLIPDQMHDSVFLLGVGELNDLPTLYREASVTVLPSVWEAFGMVLVESLACGTPVVGTRHGGIPDIITSEEIGQLFEPGTIAGAASNCEGLVHALLKVIALSHAPGTVVACRRWAEAFSWNQLGTHYEKLYREIISS